MNSNAKGGKYERDLSKQFMVWTGVEFARVPQSGGLGWQNRMQITGDIIPTDPADMVTFPFSVEAKFHREIDFEAPLLGQNVNWHEWWIQSASDAESASKLPILFMRRNKMPKGTAYCVLEIEVFELLQEMARTFKNSRGWYNYANEMAIFPDRDLFRADYSEIQRIIAEEL